MRGAGLDSKHSYKVRKVDAGLMEPWGRYQAGAAAEIKYTTQTSNPLTNQVYSDFYLNI